MSIDLKQLSARLGLSPTTVSRALNGYTDVSAATRQRVERMASELGYQPNLAARRLARGQADAVGIVYPLDASDLGDPHFLQIVQGISDRLEDDRMDLLLASARENSELRTYERLVKGGRIDGVIVARTHVVDARIDYLRKARIPFVAYGRTADCADFAWFDFDNEAGTVLAVQELARRGHRDIAYVRAPLHFNFAHQRHAGFRRAMGDFGRAVRPELVVDGGLSRRAGYAAALRLLAVVPLPSAIIVDNHLSGVGVVRALLDHAIAIGRTISVVVYDGLPADTVLVGVPIASVEQPTDYESGRFMADMLLAQIQGREVPERQVLLQPVFVGADSIGPAP